MKHCHNTIVCICIVIVFYAVATACPESVNVLAIVGGVVGGIVAVGLALLLIWKLFTFIHDRREFAKFEKERQNAKWDTVSLILLLLPKDQFLDLHCHGGGGTQRRGKGVHF